MKLEILSSDYSFELVGHPDGVDRGGYIKENRFECVIKTSFGTVYYESSYTDEHVTIDKFEASCDVSSPLGQEVEKMLKQIVENWVNEDNTDVESCCGEYSDREVLDLLESKFTEFEDYPPSPEVVHEVICRMTPGVITVNEGVVSVEFFGTTFTNLDDVHLDRLLWMDSKLYCWHEELQVDESVRAAFNQAMDRTRDQFRSRRKELDAECQIQKRDQQLECLREFFQSKVLDMVEEQNVIDLWREVHDCKTLEHV